MVPGEELGFVGCMALLLILFFIILKVILNAKNSSEFEGKGENYQKGRVKFFCSAFFVFVGLQYDIKHVFGS